MKNKEYLNQTIKVIIDRPLGSKHPQYDYIYPINYGYVSNTISGDGEKIDCYILGVDEPIKEFEGKCIAIIHRIDDDDDKLIIVPEGKKYNTEEIEKQVEFQEKYFEHIIIK